VTLHLLRRWRWEILEQPPNSPDMSSCDYDLFTKMKETLRGKRYNTREAIIRAVGRSLLDINRRDYIEGM
jgi:transposase